MTTLTAIQPLASLVSPSSRIARRGSALRVYCQSMKRFTPESPSSRRAPRSACTTGTRSPRSSARASGSPGPRARCGRPRSWRSRSKGTPAKRSGPRASAGQRAIPH